MVCRCCCMRCALAGAGSSHLLPPRSSPLPPSQPNASLVTYMWSEALELLTAGLLVIPEGVRVIFTDAGAGVEEKRGGESLVHGRGCARRERKGVKEAAATATVGSQGSSTGERCKRPSLSPLSMGAGAGFIRADANFSAYAHGIYYHTAMYDGNANQLTEMGAARPCLLLPHSPCATASRCPAPLQSPSTASSPRWVRRRARPMRPTSSSTTRPTSSRAP